MGVVEGMNQVRNETAGATSITHSFCFVKDPTYSVQKERERDMQANKQDKNQPVRQPGPGHSIRNKSTQVNCIEEFPLDSSRSQFGG